MSDVIAFPAASPQPVRGVGWVIVTAAALLAIGVWLIVMLQLALVVGAERMLHQIVAEANAFAELPSVRPAELRAFVNVRIERAGWPAVRTLILPHVAQPHRYHVVQVEVPATAALPEFLRPLAVGLGDRTLHVGSIPDDKLWRLFGVSAS